MSSCSDLSQETQILDCVFRTSSGFRTHRCKNIHKNKSKWNFLFSPTPISSSFSCFMSKLKCLTTSSENQATILIENCTGHFSLLRAFLVSENIAYILDVPPLPDREVELTFPLILYRNPLMFSFMATGSEGPLQFTTLEVAAFLYCLDESGISSRMLNLDGCFIVLDRFIIAMAFIYLVRIGFQYHDFSLDYILAALFVAHKMEEDLCPGTAFMDLLRESLPSTVTLDESVKYEKRIVALHTEILKNLNFRCLVDKSSCQKIIDRSPHHPFWNRRRLGFHCGAVTRSYHEWKLHSLEKVTGFDLAKIGPSTSTSTKNNVTCCVMCLGNHHSSINLKDRFLNSTSQFRHMTKICRALKMSAEMLSESVYNDLDKVSYIQPHMLGLDNTEPFDYLCALAKECVIEEILIRGRRLQELSHT